MKKTILPIISLFFLLSCPLFLIAQMPVEEMSLTELLQASREKAIAKKEAVLDLKTAELNFAIYRADLKPQINGRANLPNYSKTFSEITQPDGTILFQSIRNNNSAVGLQLTKAFSPTGGTVFMTSSLQRFDDFENKEFNYNGNPIRIGFFQPLLSFNPLKWDKQMEPLKLKEAEKKYAADVEAIHNDAVNLFAELLVVHQELEIAIANEKGNETLYQHAQEKFKLGKISKRDLMRLQLELISAQKDRKQGEQLQLMASSRIYGFLGKKYEGQRINPKVPIPAAMNVLDGDLALKKALENHHNWISYSRRRMEADRNLEQVKKDGGVNLDLQASFGWVRSSKNLADIYGNPQQEQFAQLQLNVPLVDWGKQKNQVALAKAQKDFTEQQIQQEQLLYETTVRQLVDQINYLTEELKLNQEIQKVASERFEITQQSFVLGAINTTELILAQQERDQASRALIYTIRDYWQAYYDLRNRTLYDFEKEENLTYQ